MVTQDRDFLRLAAEAKGDHLGIVYAPQGRSIGELVRLLDLLAQVSDVEEMRGRVEYICTRIHLNGVPSFHPITIRC
jgi:hypothetical protein